MKIFDNRIAKRQQYDAKNRELRKLEKRWLQIDKLLRSAPSIPYPKPVFGGYKKFHVVRDDIDRSFYGSQARLVLPYIGDTQFSRVKVFTKKNRKTKKVEDIPHDLYGISQWDWQYHKLDEVFPLTVRKLFKLKFVDSGKRYNWRDTGWRFVFIKPWWFVSKIQRHYYTHYREANGVLESEKTKIYDKLSQEHYWVKRYGNHRDDWDLCVTKKRLDDQYTQGFIDLYLDQVEEDE